MDREEKFFTLQGFIIFSEPINLIQMSMFGVYLYGYVQYIILNCISLEMKIPLQFNNDQYPCHYISFFIRYIVSMISLS